MSNNNVMDGNTNQLCDTTDSILKYVFKLPKMTITIMNLDIFLEKIHVCTDIM